MKVWVDDERPMPVEYDVHIKNATEAVELIRTGKVKLISLDHDLGNDDAGTGYTIACFIEYAALNKLVPEIELKVHSANPIGAKKIQMAFDATKRFWKGTQ